MNNTAKTTTESCTKYSMEQLFDYSDDTLSEEEKVAFEKHLPNCMACLQLLDSFQAFNYVSESTEKEFYCSKEKIDSKLWYTTIRYQFKYNPASLIQDFFQSLLVNWKKTSLKFGIGIMVFLLVGNLANRIEKSDRTRIVSNKDWASIYEKSCYETVVEFNVVSKEREEANKARGME